MRKPIRSYAARQSSSWHSQNKNNFWDFNESGVFTSQLLSLLTLRKNCLYSEFFWPVFIRIRTEYGEILRISPYSVPMRENVDQENSEYGHVSLNFKIHCNYLVNHLIPGVH